MVSFGALADEETGPPAPTDLSHQVEVLVEEMQPREATALDFQLALEETRVRTQELKRRLEEYKREIIESREDLIILRDALHAGEGSERLRELIERTEAKIARLRGELPRLNDEIADQIAIRAQLEIELYRILASGSDEGITSRRVASERPEAQDEVSPVESGSGSRRLPADHDCTLGAGAALTRF